MWMIEDCQRGRISQGKSHQGNVPETVTLQISGKRLYQLQHFLEEEIAKGGDYFRVRWLVMASEDLRNGVSQLNLGDNSPISAFGSR